MMQNLNLSIAVIVFLCAVLSIWLPSLHTMITVLTALFGSFEIYSQSHRITEFNTPAPAPPPIDSAYGD